MKDKLENLRGVCSQCQTGEHELKRLPNKQVVLEQHEFCGEKWGADLLENEQVAGGNLAQCDPGDRLRSGDKG